MTLPVQPMPCLPKTATRSAIVCVPRRQHGVVLIIALILLVVISLLALTSMRNAGSSENVAGNVRTTELATEAAEIALRFCENQVLTLMGGPTPPPSAPTLPTSPPTPVILEPTDPPKWQDISPLKAPAATSWWDDSPNTMAFALDLSLVNQATLVTTYKRPPECMIEMQFPAGGVDKTLTSTSSFVITARGFGPDVTAANTARARPLGTEVWLQSNIQIQP